MKLVFSPVVALVLMAISMSSTPLAASEESGGDCAAGAFCGWCEAGRAITKPLDPSNLPPEFATASFSIFRTVRHVHGTCEEDDDLNCWPETPCKMTVLVRLGVPPGVAVINTTTGQCHAGGSSVGVIAVDYVSSDLECGQDGQANIRDVSFSWGLGTCTGGFQWVVDTTLRFWCWDCSDLEPVPGDYDGNGVSDDN